MTPNFYIESMDVNIQSRIATVRVAPVDLGVGAWVPGQAFAVVEQLASVHEGNVNYLAQAVEAFDWSTAELLALHYIAPSGDVMSAGVQPSPNHTFDHDAKQWTDPRTLQDLKDAKWLEIKQARSAAEYGGFTWDGSTFDCDAISQARIQGAVQLAGMAPNFAIDWTLADNQVRTLSAADMLSVGAALGLHVATQFSRARVLRGQIEAAASLDDLNAVAWA